MSRTKTPPPTMEPTKKADVSEADKAVSEFDSPVDNSAMFADDETRVNIRTIVAVIAINFAMFGQIVSLVGSGFLAQTMAGRLGDSSKAVWFTSVLTITTMALNPPISQAADYWGRKWFVVISNALAAAGSIVVSRANGVSAAIGGFVIMGAAFGTQSLLVSVVSETLPRKYRGIGQGSINASTGLAGVVALLVGGALIRQDVENFRIYWYITCGLYLVATLGVLVGYNPPSRELQQVLSTGQKLKALDWVGFFLVSTGLTLFATGLQFYGNPYVWTDAAVLGPFIVGLCLLIAFCLYEWLGRTDGLVHHGIFRDRNFAIALVAITAEGLSFITTNSYFAFEVSALTHVNTFEAAVHLSVGFIVALTCSMGAGLLITKTKSIREPLIFGFAMLVAYNACMTSITPTSGEAPYWGYAALSGVALGFIVGTVTTAAQMSAPPELISVSTSLVVASRSVGGTVGAAVNNAIFSNGMNSAIPSNVAGAVLPLGFPPTQLGDLISALLSGNPDLVAKVSGNNSEIALAAQGALAEAYSASFHRVWIAATCFCAVGLLASCFFRNTKSEFSATIDAPIGKGEGFEDLELSKSTTHQPEHIEVAGN